MKTIKTLIDEDLLQDRIQDIANKINQDYKGKKPIMICILKGAVYFFTDLTRKLNFDPNLSFMKASSYEGENSTGKVDIKLDVDQDIKGKDVIIVEDIIDTGRTITLLYDYLFDKEPKSIKLCVLLDKPERREVRDIEPDYTGFVIPNRFVIGYGLDYDEQYRTIPNISCLVDEDDPTLEKDIENIKTYVKKRKNIN